MSAEMLPSEQAEACAERITKPGMWTTGMLHNGQASCALGTIARISATGTFWSADVRDLTVAFNRITAQPRNCTCGAMNGAHFNDCIAKTAQDVADKFIEVAKAFRNEGR